jgi:nucleotide-binding universal stress UspA family protein
MKSIFIATDFSDAAKNAADYAAQLSKITGSSLVVFHAWSLPAVSGETLAFSLTISDLEKDQQKAIQAEVHRLKKKWGVKVEGFQKMGFAADEIAHACKEHELACVVMGMRFHNNVGKFFGSVTTAFIHQNIIPVLIVPEKVHFEKPKHILLATDLNTDSDWHELDTLKEFSEKLNTNIHILNVREKEYATNAIESRAGIRLEARLKNITHSWHFHKDGNVVDEIFKTANEVSADWLALVPHRLPWGKNLFHSSVSSETAFTSTRPLLALPEHKS